MKRIKALKALSLLVLGLLSSVGHASEWAVFEFTGHGSAIQFNNGVPAEFPVSGPQNYLNVGTAIHGYVYYEVNTPYAFSGANGGGGTYTGYSSRSTIGIKFTSSTGYSFVPNSGGLFDSMLIIDDFNPGGGADILKVVAAEHTASGADQDIDLTLTDRNNGSSLNGTALPSALSFSDYTGALTLYWNDNNGHSFSFFADLDTLNQITPVPEPQTYAMLLAGLALLGLARRRGFTARAAAATTRPCSLPGQ